MKIYKIIKTLEEVTDKTLDDILIEIAVPIIKFNREHDCIDDNFNDIIFDFFDKYECDDKDIIEERIREIIKTSNLFAVNINMG